MLDSLPSLAAEASKPPASYARYADDAEGAELACLSYSGSIVAQDAADTRRTRRAATLGVAVVGATVAAVASVAEALNASSSTVRPITAATGAGIAGASGIIELFQSIFENDLGSMITNQTRIEEYLKSRDRGLDETPPDYERPTAPARSGASDVDEARTSLRDTIKKEHPRLESDVIERCMESIHSMRRKDEPAARSTPPTGERGPAPVAPEEER